ncbi:MAG: competence/damage-inducible protein A [Flavobacteriales bacterium]|nr:competence/damage-inducible protein A [Flavobacteriales bacterium]
MKQEVNVEIITIGDEILIGQIIDTNSAWMASALNRYGIGVLQISSVRDRTDHILKALAEAEERADVILITGGLGPTPDDLTKDTLARYFNVGLKTNETALEVLKEYGRKRGRTLSDVILKQADLPENARSMPNAHGSAPGMWFEERGKIFVSMPGVPYEMKAMMESYVLPWLNERFNLPSIQHRTVLTVGVGESTLEEMIRDWEKALPDYVKLAYLPGLGMVRLRLTARGGGADTTAMLDKQVNSLKDIIGKFIYGYEEDTLPGVIGQLLLEKKATVAVAESCTGGYIGHMITGIPGSSDYFKGGIISYSNEIKESLLGVSAQDLIAHGAVSEPVVRQMAEGARKALQADYAVATSGIAGPGGGTEEKPVGMVWVAVSGPHKTECRMFRFGDHRGRNIQLSATAALNMLRILISEAKGSAVLV